MKKHFLLNILMIFYFAANSQFVVSLNSDFLNDTIKICKGTELTFYAFGIYDGDTLSDLNYKWDFDDGYFEYGTDMDTIIHEFTVSKLNRVMVTIWNDTLWDYAVFPVQLGLSPIFIGTKADLPDGQTGVCNGDNVYLKGVALINPWTETRQNIRNEVFPMYIDTEHPYSSYITRRSFNIDQTLLNPTDIDSIGVKLEHSNTSNVRISLTCPTGKTVVLKDTGGVEKYFGEPIIEVGDFSEGLEYWYYFTNFPTNGTMNTFAGSDTLPSGTYQPDSSFAKLAGCSLNGDWTILVEDFEEDNNDGYLKEWALFFDENIEADTIKYHNTYSGGFWSATNEDDEVFFPVDNVSEVIPNGYGTHNFTFSIKDNYGCWPDTSDIQVIVEKPVFNNDKPDGRMEIGDSIHVTDSTSWAVAWEWDFDDLSDIIYKEEYYKKYLDSGYYQIILTAYSESGCFDFDTTDMEIYPRDPLLISDYNIFTPNGDGVNDVFTFFVTDDEKITAANIAEIHGGVYNRYGELVCRWNDPEKVLKGWNGTKNNDGIRNVPSGFYYYSFVIKGKNGKKYDPFSGTIYLYRPK